MDGETIRWGNNPGLFLLFHFLTIQNDEQTYPSLHPESQTRRNGDRRLDEVKSSPIVPQRGATTTATTHFDPFPCGLEMAFDIAR
jgi:hypothetical protein